MSKSNTRREDGSQDARTLDATLQQHLTGAQPDLERPTEARLEEKTPRDRRTRKRFLRKPNRIGTAPRDHRPQQTVTNFLTNRQLNAKVVICPGLNRVLLVEPSGVGQFQRHLP